jgi:hypothetical protein
VRHQQEDGRRDPVKILFDVSPKKIREYSEKSGYEFWQLRTPLTGYARCPEVPWALDNGCFSSFNRPKWERMVIEAEGDRPLFVTLPDIVGDARRTLELFDHFKLFTNEVPRALVLQDGIGRHRIPWDDLAAVFIGGSDDFKYSAEATNAAKTAKMLNKWVHVGRVNTASRVRNWAEFADSIDGSGLCRFDHMLEDTLAAIRGEHPQQQMRIA